VKLYGYTGGNQRVAAVRDQKRITLAWGEEITDEELAPYRLQWLGFDIQVEPVTDPKAERRAHPIRMDCTKSSIA